MTTWVSGFILQLTLVTGANDHMAPNVGRHILADSAQLAGFSSGIPDTTPAHLILGEGLWPQSINKWVAGPEGLEPSTWESKLQTINPLGYARSCESDRVKLVFT